MHSKQKASVATATTVVAWALAVAVWAMPERAWAQGGGEAFDNVMELVHAQTGNWVGPLSDYGRSLFLMLFTTEFTFRCAELASAQKGVEAISHFLVMRIVYFAFWFGLLMQAEWVTHAIPDSVMQLERAAGGNGVQMGPQEIMSQGLEIVTLTLGDVTNAGITDLVGALAMYFTSLFLLLCFFGLAAMFAIAQVKVWFIAAAGVFVLGFAGSSWTRGLAEGYLKSLLAVSVKLMVISLIVRATGGIVRGIHDLGRAQGGLGGNLETYMGALVVMGFVVFMAKSVPDAVGAMITGGSSGGFDLAIMAFPGGAGRAARSAASDGRAQSAGRVMGRAAVAGLVGTGAWAASKARSVGSSVAGAFDARGAAGGAGASGGTSGSSPVSGSGGAGGGTDAAAQARRDAAVLPPMGGVGASGAGSATPVSGGTSTRGAARGAPGGGARGAAVSDQRADATRGGFGSPDAGWPEPTVGSEAEGAQAGAPPATGPGEEGEGDDAW